jgi:beta-lactamase class A
MPALRPRRRDVFAGGLALVGLGAAGCAPRVGPRPNSGPLNVRLLADGLPSLADRARPGLLNLAVMEVGGGAPFVADPAGLYPLAGLAKLPVVAATLARVDAGRLRLNTRIELTAADLAPPPSRINAELLKRPGGGVLALPVADLISLAIQQDDSTASDILLRMIGGPAAVTAWIQGRGVAGLRVDRSERDRLCDLFATGPFKPDWASPEAWAAAREAADPAVRQGAMDSYLADPRDTTTAPGALDFLNRLATGALLVADSGHFLLSLMKGSAPASGLAAGLPADAVLAHKVGATPTALGFTTAADELAIVTLAGGARLAVAAFLAGSTATAPARADLFAGLGALVARAMNPT